jgi:alpha-amylase
MKICFSFVAFFVLRASMSQTTVNTILPSQFPNRVAYQVFIRSFADSEGNGIGDINGIRGKLGYLKELGIGALWITPVFASPSYHKYDVTDYYAIDASCGTREDLKNLVKEAHEKGIRIILDFVANHTSAEHPWFKAALNGDKTHKEHYYWSSDTSEWHKEPDHWHWVDDEKKGTEKYYGFFWRGMPDLNYDNPVVRSEMIKAAKYWITECDIDGYRLDAASHVYPYPERKKNYAWWKEFTDAVRSVKPDFYIVGEMWGGDTLIAPYLKAGMNAGFNFDLWFNIKSSLKDGKDNITSKLVPAYKNYASNNPGFCDAVILSNHDNPRIMDEVEGDMAKAKLAAAILFTLPYTPYIYYGDELGMFGPKPDEHIREPFLWDAEDPMRCHWEQNFHNAETMKLGEQMKDAKSLYHTYKKWIALRNADDVLTYGSFALSPLKQEGLLLYERQWNDKIYLVVHNLNSNADELLLSRISSSAFRMIATMGAEFSTTLPVLKLEPYGTAIIQR